MAILYLWWKPSTFREEYNEKIPNKKQASITEKECVVPLKDLTRTLVQTTSRANAPIPVKKVEYKIYFESNLCNRFVSMLSFSWNCFVEEYSMLSELLKLILTSLAIQLLYS